MPQNRERATKRNTYYCRTTHGHPAMTILVELAEAVSLPNSILRGLSFAQVVAAFQTFSDLSCLRTSSSGVTRSRAVSRVIEKAACERHNLSVAQCRALQGLFDKNGRPDMVATARVSLPRGEHGKSVVTGAVSFITHNTHCCQNRQLRKRNEIRASVYEVDRCFNTNHIVMECCARDGCGASYYFDKMVIKDKLPSADCYRHHLYRPYYDGEPRFIASKSGAIIISTQLLRSFNFMVCIMRSVF